MNTKHILTGITCWLLTVAAAHAHERIFTYTYEPATPPKGELEYEQHITLRAGRAAAVGQSDFYRMEFREEVEFGVTDNYQVSLYFNQQYEHFRNPATGLRASHFGQTGFSLENLYMVLNPTEHKVGLALYLEPTYDGENFELEEKIILGQRYGNWRWALNLTHATEWANNFREKEGEFETTFGLTRQWSSRWWLGVEFRNHNEIPEYKEWENTAFYLGPVVCYRRANWFATLTVMPQIYGANFTGDPDKNHHLELEGHERVNVRLILGVDF
jgi:hypothetical protein